MGAREACRRFKAVLPRLEREGLVTFSRDAYGDVSTAKLTRFAKHLLGKA